MPQRRQLVGDDQRRPPVQQLGDGRLQAGLGDRVDARRRLVEHDEVGLAQPDPGQRQQLCLAGRQPGAAGAELAVDATGDERVEADAGAARRATSMSRRRRVEQRDVVADRAFEQLDLLGHERDAAAQLGQRDVGDRHAAELDDARSSPRRGAAAVARTWSCRCRSDRRRRPTGRRRSRGRRRGGSGRRRRRAAAVAEGHVAQRRRRARRAVVRSCRGRRSSARWPAGRRRGPSPRWPSARSPARGPAPRAAVTRAARTGTGGRPCRS